MDTKLLDNEPFLFSDVAVTPEELRIDWQSPGLNYEKELRAGREPESKE
jgi:hypothetical protein